MKKPLILNLVWAGVAGAAFYTGWKVRPATEGDDAGGVKIRQAATSPLAGGNSKNVNPAMVSKNAEVLDFYKSFGFDTGVPLTAEKMQEAVLQAVRETDPVKSQLMFARLMEELTPENAGAALTMIRENVGGFDTMRYMGMLAYKWGQVDPASAMKELSSGDDRRGGRMGQTVALSGWATSDPKAAIAWLDSQGLEGPEKEWMSRSLVDGLARSDAETAMKYASGLEDENARRSAAESIAREMIRSGGVDKASTWLGSLTDPDMKRGAFQTLSEQILRSDPAKAAEFVKQYAGENYATGAIGNVAGTMARKDVQQGLAFANSLSGEAQARAVGSVIGQWLDNENGAHALEASKYVESLPAGTTKDAGAQAIAREVSRQDPATAIAWASSIQNTEQRTDTIVDIGRQYLRQDPAAANTWLAQSGLPAETIQEITSPRRGGGDWGGFGPGGGGGGGGRGGFGGGGGGRGQGGGGGGGRRGGR